MNKLPAILAVLIISLPAINAKPKKDYSGAKYFTWVDYSEAKDWVSPILTMSGLKGF